MTATLATVALLTLAAGLAMPRLGMNAHVQGTSILLGLGFAVTLYALLWRSDPAAGESRGDRGVP